MNFVALQVMASTNNALAILLFAGECLKLVVYVHVVVYIVLDSVN